MIWGKKWQLSSTSTPKVPHAERRLWLIEAVQYQFTKTSAEHLEEAASTAIRDGVWLEITAQDALQTAAATIRNNEINWVEFERGLTGSTVEELVLDEQNNKL